MAEKRPTQGANVPLRQGATRVEVYNEGLFVFAYDAANEAPLRDEGALDVLLSAPADAAAEARAAELATSGRIVIWELVQDDPRLVDVAVGPALSAREKKMATWHPPQTALLSLPSGELRIHTYNTCPIADAPGTDPPGEVTVPPGDYVFTLHRVDWQRMDETLSEREDLPTEFITLTPRTDKPPKKWAAVLTLDDLFGKDMRWVRTGKVEPDRFKGLLKRGPSGGLVTNLGPRDADAMGLRFADRLRLEVDGWRSEAIYLGHAGTFYTGHVFGMAEYASRFTSATPLGLQYEPLDPRGTVVLELCPWGREAPVLPAVPEEGLALSVTRIEPPAFPPLDRALVGSAVIEKGGTIRATVAFGTGVAVLLNVTWKELKKAKIGFTDSILARFTTVAGAESERLVHLDTAAAKKAIAAAREALADQLAVSAEAQASLAAAKKKFSFFGPFDNAITQHEVMDAIADEPTAADIAAHFPLIAKEYQHPDVTGQSVLILLPLLRDRTHLEVAPGSPVSLRKA